MSLILDALKKSEAERRMGRPPGLLSQTSIAPPRRAKTWPWFGAVLLPLLLAAAWWYGRSSAPEPQPDPTAAVREPQSGAASPSQPASLQQEPDSTTARSAPAPAPVAVQAPAQSPVPDVAAPVASPRPGTAAAHATAPAPKPAAAEREVLPSTPTRTLEPRPEQGIARSDAEPGGGAAASERSVPAPAVASAEPPHLRDLSPALRAELPPLRVSMHVFDADPTRRFVLIDGHRLSEGAKIATELELLEIRRDGSVLRFRGQLFLLPRPG